MYPQRPLLRSYQRAGTQLRTSLYRPNIQRRLAHVEGPPLTGAADNAFNRERQAVKAHAAATSGKPLTDTLDELVTITLYRSLAQTITLVKHQPFNSVERDTDRS